MYSLPWFPLGQGLPGGAVGLLKQEGVGYQIVESWGTDQVILVVESGSLACAGLESLPEAVRRDFRPFAFAGRSFRVRVFDHDDTPLSIGGWPAALGLPTAADTDAIGRAIRRLRQNFPNADVRRALFLPALGACLPVCDATGRQNLRALAIEVLAAGARDPSLNVADISAINPFLRPAAIDAFLAVLAGEAPPSAHPLPAVDPVAFKLAGRPDLERLLRERVLGPVAHCGRDAVPAVRMPNGILLSGPAGCGKSHAVAALKTALGWPAFEIDLGAVASPYVHRTSVAFRRTFDDARHQAPALVVIEEIDAVAARGPRTRDHGIEEVAELLHLVEIAADSGILVIATTNRPELLDPAILRKGRFDHTIEVGYPGRDEVSAALAAMLQGRPHAELPNLRQLAARLAGHPMSDVAWVVNEAARLAARGNKNAIDEIDLFSALRRLNAR